MAYMHIAYQLVQLPLEEAFKNAAKYGENHIAVCKLNAIYWQFPCCGCLFRSQRLYRELNILQKPLLYGAPELYQSHQAMIVGKHLITSGKASSHHGTLTQ